MAPTTYGYAGLVEVALGGGAGQMDASYVEHLLARATDILDARVPSLRARVDLDDDLRGRADRIAADMVARLLRNPDGARSRSSTKGPFTESITYAEAPGELVLTDDERTSLLPPATGRTGARRLGSIRLARPW